VVPISVVPKEALPRTTATATPSWLRWLADL
jgi:hypothetical protein